MRVAASTTVGESSLSEANDIFVRTPEDGKNVRCSFNKKKEVVLHAYCHLPHAALVSEAINMKKHTYWFFSPRTRIVTSRCQSY